MLLLHGCIPDVSGVPGLMSETDIRVAAEGVWQVVGELNFETVPRLSDRARRLDPGRSDLIVDLSGVTRANSAGLVLLLEWLNEGRRQRRTVRFRHLPDSLQNIARMSNAIDLLPIVPAEEIVEAAPQKAAPAARKKTGVRRKKRKPRRWR